MASVLWEIIIPLLVAFGVGLLIGWLLWRWRRKKVTTNEWARLTSSADSAEQRAVKLASERDGLGQRVAALTADLEASESATGVLRGELEAAEGKLGLVSSDQAKAAGQVNDLEEKLSAALKRADGLEEGQKDARARAAEHEGEMAELRARARHTAAELDDLKAQLGERDTKLKQAEDRAAKAVSDTDSSRSELESQQSRADTLEAEAESARSMARRLDQELGDARRGASTVEGDLLAARARIEELESLVASGPATSTAPVGFVGAEEEHESGRIEPSRGAPDASYGEPDNLQLIDGVGPKLERFLHEQGITTFEQLAAVDFNGVASLQEKLTEFPGRIEREEWVPQARRIASGTTLVRVVPKSERDDLKRIKGVGPVLERWLHGRGIYRFVDLTALDTSAVAKLSAKLEDFPGRIEREEWVQQAGELAKDTTPKRQVTQATLT